MRKFSVAAGLAILGMTTGCVPLGALGIKSSPLPTYVDIYNAPAADYLRKSPPLGPGLGPTLASRRIDADGLVFGLAVSGGGERATAFTLGVLAELQTLKLDDGTRALDGLDFISSNSGGSWGVARYLMQRYAKGPEFLLQDQIGAITDGFVRAAKGRQPCWPKVVTEAVGSETFAQLYAEGRADPLPAAYFNAALLPAQSPFVFTADFIDHYGVRAVNGCPADRAEPVASLADLPVVYAAAASGTVPGFYYAWAQSSLCPAEVSAQTPSFCFTHQSGGARSYLRIADGGLYDNLGYKTAWEVMDSVPSGPGQRRVAVLINSGTDLTQQFVARGDRKGAYLTTILSNGLFAVQDATVQRLYAPLFRKVGVGAPVVLDFYGAAKFREDQTPLLTGLDQLVDAAANGVPCYEGTKLIRPRRSRAAAGKVLAVRADFEANLARLSRSNDCRAMNFYRFGTLAKTTYAFDAPTFVALWQLGQLVVRMQQESLVAAFAAPPRAPTP